MNFSGADRRVLIENPVETLDGMGGVSVTWAAVATVWAKRRNLKGRELVEAGAQGEGVEAMFSIRYGSNVSAVSNKSRITDRGVAFDVVSVVPVPGGRPERLDLFVKWRLS